MKYRLLFIMEDANTQKYEHSYNEPNLNNVPSRRGVCTSVRGTYVGLFLSVTVAAIDDHSVH